MGACWDTPAGNAPIPSKPRSGFAAAPALPVTWQSWGRAGPGGSLSGTHPQALAGCSLVGTFALCPLACMLCRQADSSEICGPKHRQQGLCVHECCLVSSSRPRPLCLSWRCGAGPGGPVRVTDEGWLCSLQCCFACGERGASNSCQEKGCSCSFHLPCASEHGCVTQFFKEFRRQAHPNVETTFIICLEPMGDKTSHNTMVCPACKGAWFHQGCIQGQAVRAGRSCFHCPQCNNKRKFLPETLRMGIPVPIRTPAWEEDGGYEELYQRHSWCDASQCLSRQGREQAEEGGLSLMQQCHSCQCGSRCRNAGPSSAPQALRGGGGTSSCGWGQGKGQPFGTRMQRCQGRRDAPC
uniref:PHF7 protein n=1 Tax=Dromaius novaehollandiae TaxID=8790 RepID=A0A8C4JG17_DRONO